MNTVSTEIEIAVPPAEVWAVVMAPDRFAEWVTIHRGVKLLTPDPAARGARMDQDMQMHGVNFKVRWSLEQVRAPSFAEWKGRGPAFSRALIRYQLEPTSADTTRFIYTNEFSTPGGPLADFANRLVIGHSSEHEARESLERLKALLERKS